MSPSHVGSRRPPSTHAAYGAGPLEPLTHELVFAHRLRLHCRLRYAVVAAILLGGPFAAHVVGVEGLDLRATSSVALVIALYNVAARHVVKRADPARPTPMLWLTRHLTTVADYAMLAVLLTLVGGVRSPFVALFTLHLALNCFMLSYRSAWLNAALAYALLSGLVGGEWAGWFSPAFPAGAVVSSSPLGGRFALTVLTVNGVLFVATTYLLTSLAESMRSHERKIILANSELERLSRTRRMLLHVMMHDLKSPLSAASMLLDNVQAGFAGPVSEGQRALVSRSLTRLGDASALIRDLGILATLEQADLVAPGATVAVTPLLLRVAEEHRELAEQRRHELIVESAEVGRAYGDERLLREAIANLVSNAIKYTPTGGRVVLRAWRAEGRIRLEVEDNGVGIAPADQARLFEEFVRLAPSLPDGEQPRGSGLGLSIAQRILEAHGDSIAVASAPGRGSVFSCSLCAAPDAPSEAASDAPATPTRQLAEVEPPTLESAAGRVQAFDAGSVRTAEEGAPPMPVKPRGDPSVLGSEAKARE